MWLIPLVPFPGISIFSLIPSGAVCAIDHKVKVDPTSVAANVQMCFEPPELLPH